ncbi:MAG: glutamine-hydrolyzing carbamoyl-phosphate synthase small subunit [Ignavibacteriaceae bacterium]
MDKIKGVLVLEDGTSFEGVSFGSVKSVNGEVVFNTGMVGYPETLTDPSYCGQIIVMTYPLIGNYGVPDAEYENGLKANFESDKIHARALIVADYSEGYSHWNGKKSLSQWLKEEEIPALFGIDTRKLTKIIRDNGTVPGKIIFDNKDVPFEDPNRFNLVERVSVPTPTEYSKGKKKIAVVDCGVKNNILHAFLRRDISLLRVPYDYDFTKEKCDGIVISNGPGDPKMCGVTIENTKRAMSLGKPILGICLGSQIMGLAAGGDTYKLKFGHRSHNQPVNEAGTRRCYITSQNHGYAIDSQELQEDWRDWFTNDNDGTNEGIMHIYKPFFGAQFHPEASPGPDDTEFIFDMFVRALK